ncbi:DEAD/DEAH box helicase family protein [Tuberibacillus sp. Marseille-P3662]|uniref:DEAD/DEAH box helicase family protein n=1 Tax=Tuberibacillus sp. Marseille-P3662 TaxID=1965358 RepID=UPI0015933F25|nr:DEAD/DEAH box helicase family protein [Tuberibacillus sp. Marseille-P3662]
MINDFYIPVLSKTITYRRAVGYFTSSSLTLAAKGLSELIDRGGQMQLIASPYLDKDDIEAIELGYKFREEVIEQSLLKQLDEPSNLVDQERLNYLAWLVSNSQLDIKIAVLKDRTALGLYHEKLGIMEDYEGNKIAFSGSSNETEGGFVNNFESIDVFCSWDPRDEQRVAGKEEAFNNLWEDANGFLDVIDFPTAVEEKLLTYKKNSYKSNNPSTDKQEVNEKKEDYGREHYPHIPEYINVREYQQEAIRSWFRNKCQGMLEMATGTGKTITALTAISKLYEYTKRLGVIIVCPYTHLVNQWVDEIKEFNMSPIVAYGGESWDEELGNHISSFNAGITDHFCVITTNDTFSLQRMQYVLKKLNQDVVFVADEAHHLGAKKRREKLLDAIPYRLALSATPNRWYDDQGTQELIGYFGGEVVYEFGLKKAIGRFLTEYFYYPHIVYLDEDESEEYYSITRKLVKFMVSDNGKLSDEESKTKEQLLIKRARILSGARNKIVKLNELMKNQTQSKYNIVYCGDSRVDGDKQIERVIKLLGYDLDMKVHSFTANENNEDRKKLLERFADGDLQALVAIKCLDEGVDVPATQNAYIISSSTNPREFIQRRGRVLRKHKSKEFSYIHDFIVLPRHLKEINDLEPTVFNIERNLVKRELTRFTEFANLAINGPLAHKELDEIKEAYNLLDF